MLAWYQNARHIHAGHSNYQTTLVIGGCRCGCGCCRRGRRGREVTSPGQTNKRNRRQPGWHSAGRKRGRATFIRAQFYAAVCNNIAFFGNGQMGLAKSIRRRNIMLKIQRLQIISNRPHTTLRKRLIVRQATACVGMSGQINALFAIFLDKFSQRGARLRAQIP